MKDYSMKRWEAAAVNRLDEDAAATMTVTGSISPSSNINVFLSASPKAIDIQLAHY